MYLTRLIALVSKILERKKEVKSIWIWSFFSRSANFTLGLISPVSDAKLLVGFHV